MAKIFDMWVTYAGIPFGKVYAEIEDRTFKYGFAPAGLEMNWTEFPVTTIHDDQEIWLTGNETLGCRIAFRGVTDEGALVKLQVFVPKPGENRKTIKQKWVSFD